MNPGGAVRDWLLGSQDVGQAPRREPALAARRAPRPMPGFGLLHPGGMVENSPTFQRWERRRRISSPGRDGRISRPYRDLSTPNAPPNAEALGYCRMSLRDKQPGPPFQFLVALGATPA